MILYILFHLFGLLQFGYGCYYDYMYVQIPSSSNSVTVFGGKFKYLTFINAMLQTIYYLVALLDDLFGNKETITTQKTAIRRFKDTLFTCLAFPLSMFVGLTFWGIYAVDRELILPKSMDPYFPEWLNQVMHTNIMAFAIVELSTSFRMYPKRKYGLSILSSFMLCYMIWVHYIYFHTGSWVYPLLRVLNWPLRVVFYLFSLVLVWGMYCLGEALNTNVWSKQIEKIVRSGKKKAK